MDALTLIIAQTNKKSHAARTLRKEPRRRRDQGRGRMPSPKREEVEFQNVRRHVTSDCYTLTRQEVGLNNLDNEGQQGADPASQTFSFLF